METMHNPSLKSISYFSAVLSAICLMFNACSQSEQSDPKPEPIIPEANEFSATIDDCDTKTSLNGLSIIWNRDDNVAIFACSDKKEEYVVKSGCDGKKTTTLVPATNSPETGRHLNSNVAFYPYKNATNCSNYNDGFALNAELPSKQQYVEGSFGKEAMPMVAVSSSETDKTLSFKNLYGVLKLKVKLDNVMIRSIDICGNSGEKIAGPSMVYCSYAGEPSIYFFDQTATKITLDCGNGVSVNKTTETIFYISMPPMTFSNGITVNIKTTDKEIVRKTNTALTIKRSAILSMPMISETPEFNGSNGTEDLIEDEDYTYPWTF